MTDRRAFCRLLLTISVSGLTTLGGLASGSATAIASSPSSVYRLPPVEEHPGREEPLLFDPSSTFRPRKETVGRKPSAVDPSGRSILKRPPPASADPLLAKRTAHERQEISVALRQAEQHTRIGFSLAARGALFSARNEFIRALRVVAHVLDAQSSGRPHAEALSDGLRALREAKDFMTSGAEDELDIDVATVVSGHRTSIFASSGEQGDIAGRVSARVALDHYYRHAHQQLATAVGSVPSASTALFGLGKVHASLAQLRPADRAIQEYRAMALYQAALSVHPANPRAANELGVLLARYGRHEAARQLLQQSLSHRDDRTVWHNLSVVMHNLGQRELARQALARAGQARVAGGIPLQRVQWLDNAAFAATRRPDAGSWPTTASPHNGSAEPLPYPIRPQAPKTR
ncbi:MAG: tetratricopeptide repeat protein [Planctomycetales bacterium]|nr:tetratricopeptide repeat protein [Planctomycetales bacterium]NIP71306.1 tetratricopeptide repeat protein [Planctomycetales bacterium]